MQIRQGGVRFGYPRKCISGEDGIIFATGGLVGVAIVLQKNSKAKIYLFQLFQCILLSL